MGIKVHDPAEIRNIALVGHGFCGKTALGEAILFNSGVTTRLGRTDQGTSTFDFEPEEQKRGGSIATAFAWVQHQGRKINILDTPGDQNFIYDSFAAMNGADAVVLVMSAADGVEVQTERFWHKAHEMHLPIILFVNKMDRERADWRKALKEVEETFGVKPLPLQIPIGQEQDFAGVVDLLKMKAFTWNRDGSGAMAEKDVPANLKKDAQAALDNLIESVASTQDELIEKYLETGELSDEELRGAFRAAFLSGEVVPVLFGAAVLNMGVQPVMDFVAMAAPSPLEARPLEVTDAQGNASQVERSVTGPFVAQVIRTFIDEFSGKVTILRIQTGAAPEDGQCTNTTQGVAERLGSLHVQRGKEREPIEKGVCGDIVSVAKLKVTHTPDTLADVRTTFKLPTIVWPAPMMSFVIVPTGKGDEDRLKVAVERLIEEDPTLVITYDELTKQMVLNGQGQAHLEASTEKMKRKFKVAVTTGLPSVPYRETVAKKVTNIEGKHKKQTGGAGQFGVCYLDVEPLPKGSGFEFVDKIFGGSIPRQFIPSVEKGLRTRLDHGGFAGYPVVDIRVSLTDGKYHPVDSKDIAFQLAGAKGLKAAMEKAGMKLLEPIYKLEIVTPTESMGDIMGDVTSRRGRVLGMDTKGKYTIITALCPLAEIQRYAPDLNSMTGGKGSFVMAFEAYEEVPSNLAEKVRQASPFRDTGDEDE